MTTPSFDGLILALDLATITGYATGCPGQSPRFGSVRFGKPGTARDQSYRMFRMWVDETLTSLEPDLVVFESAAITTAFGGKTTVETIKRLIGYCEHLEEMCYRRVELREANVSQVRGYFIGTTHVKRDAAKVLTKQKCRDYGWDVEEDNAADACALWAYQVSCLRPDLASKMTPLFSRMT